ncbi:MAG: 50S ribosomal protein L10 [Deltaproteobacteria bacterium CG1_02_45_11]|nr:MAG: 50S ribosomal protein L10 [Deltaproteobacteria bacterium CG1_02_45_11]
MRIDEKKEIVKDLSDRFSRSQVVIVTDYKSLDVTTISDLRRRLREAGVEYKVAKNSLLIRASEDTDFALIKEDFKGPNAVAFSYDDPVASAKVLTEFAAEHNELKIKTGVMKGKVLDLNAIKALATLPAREVLLSQLLATINGVPSALVRALSGVPKKLLLILQAIKAQKEAI